MRKVIIGLIALSWILCVGVVVAQENEGGGVTVSPVTFELTANPGDAISNIIKVSNPTDNVLSIKMEAEDFKAVGEEGRVVTTSEKDEDTTYSLRKWIKMVPEEFTLEPNEQKFIDFIIKVPEDAEPGGKYGSILAGVSGSLSSEGSGAAVSTKTGALVLLMVSGDLNEELVISEFSAPSFQEYGPVPFTIKFENTGTVHVKPMGFVVITDLFGKKVTEIEFSQKNVIPGAIRRNEANWDTKWLFGKYTATLVGNYGTSNTPLNPYVITFTVFPWKLSLGILIALIVIFTIIFRSRKRLRLAAKILLKGEHHAIGDLPKK